LVANTHCQTSQEMEALHRKLAAFYTPEDFELNPISLRVEPTTPVCNMETPPSIQLSSGPLIEWSDCVESLDIKVARSSLQVTSKNCHSSFLIRAFWSAKLQPLATNARLVQCLTNPHECKMNLVKWKKTQKCNNNSMK
jgi:hypothetical protein